ncbi:MAG: DUF3052 domain-containing protein [Cyclobacteriaceae bacterium]
MAVAGYSGTPLVKKLGIKPGMKILLVKIPDHYFDLLEELPNDIKIAPASGKSTADFIHLFVTEEKLLKKQFPQLKKRLEKQGTFWISWPKKTSNLPSDLDGNIVRTTGLDFGLVDVKVCAVDSDWSGLKFMFRVKDR